MDLATVSLEPDHIWGMPCPAQLSSRTTQGQKHAAPGKVSKHDTHQRRWSSATVTYSFAYSPMCLQFFGVDGVPRAMSVLAGKDWHVCNGVIEAPAVLTPEKNASQCIRRVHIQGKSLFPASDAFAFIVRVQGSTPGIVLDTAVFTT